MTCNETSELIGPYVDGELDIASTLDLERHLDRCPPCAHARDRLQGLRSTIGENTVRFTAPPPLLESIRAAITPPATSVAQPNRFRHPLRIAAALLITASLAWIATTRFWNPAGDALARELVSAHVRSLQADHLLDVPSSDRHTVKPWFAGKLDFAPDVRDLAGAGFPLAGGRLDYLDGHPVAALVYRHDRHVINCFVWATARRPPTKTSQGYSLRAITQHGLTYCAISDAAPATLDEFARALESHLAATPSNR